MGATQEDGNTHLTRVRAACHVHSDWSYDGKWELGSLACSFSRRGYRVVLLTEHDQGFDETRRLEHRKACSMASSERILLVPGIEYSDPSNIIHLLVWGNVPFVGTGMDPGKVLAATQDSGGIAVFAHPSRKDAWKHFNPYWSDKILGIEFWNRKTDGLAPSKNAWPLLSMTQAVPFAGLDFHDSRQFFPLSTFLEVHAQLNEESVLAALRARRCISRVFGLDATTLATGFSSKGLHAVESLRRLAATVYRTTVAVKTRGRA